MQVTSSVYYKLRQSYYELLQLCLLQITTKCCYKLRQLLYNYELRQDYYNYDRYYKLRQNIYFISYEIIKTVIFGIQTKQLFGPEEGVRAQLPGTSAYKRLNLM